MGVSKFNIRVYAIIMRGDDILLADETMDDLGFTKFPGGGVEPGEGLADALKRELMEEGNIRIEQTEHLYTTDFFQVSAFRPEDQIISVYYVVKADIDWKEKSSDQSIKDKRHMVRLYFYPLSELKPEKLTFPIDRYVLENYLM